MEILDKKIKQFFKMEIGSGYGDGSGDGSGSGSGSGYGYGYGSGSGDGSDDGSGYGEGLKVKTINNKKVYNIDNINTIILHINKNVAKGKIVNKDLTLEDCYIVKGNNCFAHGETMKKAMESLQEKIYEDINVEEAIKQFIEKFPNINNKYKVKDLYIWHHILTGSCEMGRKNFAKNHNLDIEKDKLTIKEFIDVTKNDYGGDIIKQLEEKYKEDKEDED